MTKPRPKMEKNGFTLIELLIAMALTTIVLTLSTTLVYSYIKVAKTIEGNDDDLRFANILRDAVIDFVDKVNADVNAAEITLSEDILKELDDEENVIRTFSLPEAFAAANSDEVLILSCHLKRRIGSHHTIILMVHLADKDFEYSMTFLREVT